MVIWFLAIFYNSVAFWLYLKYELRIIITIFLTIGSLGSFGKANLGGNKSQSPPENQPNTAPGNQFLNSSPQHFPRPQSYAGSANSAWQSQGNQPTAQPTRPDYNRTHFSSVFGERDGVKKGGGELKIVCFDFLRKCCKSIFVYSNL